MKGRNFLLFGFLLIAIALVSCEKEKEDDSKEPKTLSEFLMSGTWRVSKFIDSGTDKTASYSDYSFQFGANKSVTATYGANNYTGIWWLYTDPTKDNPNKLGYMNLFFASPNDLESITEEEWAILAYNATKLEMQHVSGGNGGTDVLTFEKR